MIKVIKFFVNIQINGVIIGAQFVQFFRRIIDVRQDSVSNALAKRTKVLHTLAAQRFIQTVCINLLETNTICQLNKNKNKHSPLTRANSVAIQYISHSDGESIVCSISYRPYFWLHVSTASRIVDLNSLIIWRERKEMNHVVPEIFEIIRSSYAIAPFVMLQIGYEFSNGIANHFFFLYWTFSNVFLSLKEVSMPGYAGNNRKRKNKQLNSPSALCLVL